jgi:glycosyltransferase involved in cell wall biosynthesis
MQDRPKILVVTSHWPLAPAYGAQQRVLNLGRLLSRFGNVSLVIVPTEVEDEETANKTKREFEVQAVMRPLTRPTEKNAWHRISARLHHEFDPTYTATDPYVVSERDRRTMLELLQQHDVVWVHTIRTAHWFRIYRWPHSVLDVDDLVSRQQRSRAQVDPSRLERLIALRRAWIWRKRERLFPERFDLLTVCSEDDRQYLGGGPRIYVIPNGSHPRAANPPLSAGLPRIGFIGNCAFAPNEEGLKWFIREVWPKIKREFAGAQLRLVGRGSDGCFKDLGSDIIGLGWLEDPGDEIASWSAMTVPIRMGSGTRVKLVEAFARGCPVVATTMGGFGYDVKDGEEILLADRADDFASACARLLKNPELGRAIAEKAGKRFLERWTWESFENTVGKVVQECLTRSRQTMGDSGANTLATNRPAAGGGESG